MQNDRRFLKGAAVFYVAFSNRTVRLSSLLLQLLSVAPSCRHVRDGRFNSALLGMLKPKQKGGMPMDKHSDDPFYDIENTQSATECTGLMPAAPETADEAEHLSRLMAIHCPPSSMWEGPGAKQSAGEAADPSDAHSSQKRRRACRPATSPAPSRPPQGRNP